MRYPWPLFRLLSVFKKNVNTIFIINVQMSISVYGAGIQTHDLQDMSLLP